MSVKKQRITTLLILVIFLAILVCALVGYRLLSDRYTPADTVPSDISLSAAGGAEKAADFTVLDGDGNPVSLSSFVGKPVVVNFWATWCPPCRAELPYFDAAWAEYGDDVVFMMVDLTDGHRDTIASATEFAAEGGYAFPLYYDTEYSGAMAYAVSAIPLSVFVDAEGNLAGTHLGAMDEATLLENIQNLLG